VHARFFDHVESSGTCDNAPVGVAFRFLNNVGTPDLPAFRGSIAGLHIFPTDASRPVSRPTVHGLGLIWVATP
jgi:hypothetical protein